MHRVGGLENQDITGNVSYDPDNHHHMVMTRNQKVLNVADEIPLQEVDGPASGDLLVLSWGGTYGACATAVHLAQKEGRAISHCHLRYIHPFPKNFESILRSFKKVLIPELNLGQLRMLVRDRFMIDAQGFNLVRGKPFSVSELKEKIDQL
jgi:2-oxoglutarate ferredoxin oxidoreductase subunit alpha